MKVEESSTTTSVNHESTMHTLQSWRFFLRQAKWWKFGSKVRTSLSRTEWLTEEVEKLGHEIIFYLMYHCELNFIENMLKAHHSANCTKFKDLQDTLPVNN